MRKLSDLSEAMKRRLQARGPQGGQKAAFHALRTVSAEPREASAGLPPGPPVATGPDPLLERALVAAAALEFATIPPYLTALWSIVDQSHPAAESIRALVHEEMLHLALVSNMLAAIGGSPKLTGDAVPTYPMRLPGDVHPELKLRLDGLTDAALEVFLEVERPQIRVPVDGLPDDRVEASADRTIGEFYDWLRQYLHEAEPDFTLDHQVAGPLAPMVITSLEDVDEAIEMIRRQGEGAIGSPVDEGPRDLAHYYRFLEIKHGRKLAWIEGRLFAGERCPELSVYPVSPPPRDGHGPAASPRIRELSTAFDACYSAALRCLERAWTGGGHVEFLRAMEHMFELRPLARDMMRTPGPDGRGHLPTFRYVPERRDWGETACERGSVGR